jgi:hypothetical protein
MRKLIKLIIVLALSVAPLSVQAAGTVVASNLVLLDSYSGIYTITYTCTADAADGSYPATTLTYLDASGTSQTLLSFFRGWHLYRIRINPGVTAPTADYDATITEESGDVTGGALADLSATVTEFRVPSIASAGTSAGIGAVTMADTWTLNLSNNSVNSAITVITLFFSK